MHKKKMIAVACLFPMSGCMQYLVQPPEPSIAGSPKQVTVNSYLGSKVQQPGLYVLAKECRNGEQLARVQVRRNFGQGLISWLTLNLYAPATIIYECANAGDPGLGDGGSPAGGER